MNFYYSYESTPLKFHNAFYKVICPILAIIRSLFLLATFGYLDGYDYNYAPLVISIFLSFLEIGSLILITEGFTNKKQYAWYMVYAFLGLTFLSSLVSASTAYSTAYAIGSIIGSLILPILIGIYYYKRKPLFVTSETNNCSASNNQTATTNQTLQNSASPYSAEKRTEISYCRKCGNRVIPNSVFCNKCGSKIYWN